MSAAPSPAEFPTLTLGPTVRLPPMAVSALSYNAGQLIRALLGRVVGWRSGLPMSSIAPTARAAGNAGPRTCRMRNIFISLASF